MTWNKWISSRGLRESKGALGAELDNGGGDEAQDQAYNMVFKVDGNR